MKVIVCCENNYGMMFNNRRVSQDASVISRITEMTKGNKLWMNSYSYTLFKGSDNSCVNIAENVLSETSDREYCYVENEPLIPYEKWIDEIIVFKWNRDYPSDLKLDVDLCKWNLRYTEEFKGNSHEKITMEVYGR